MSEGEVRNCPKCGGEMKEGKIASQGGVRLMKEGDLLGDKIRAYYCRSCGYMELYRKMKG